MSEQAIAYLKENQEALLQKLYDFLAIPSVSTDPAHKEDVQRAADFLTGYLNELGFENVEKMETKGHPLVFAEYTEAGPEAPTVLLYGHYDVQPVDPIDLWDSEPFQAEVRDGRIYARGSSDDKGQTFMHLAVFEAFLKTEGKLPMNVKVCIEGEEEIGSENLYELLQDKRTIQADFAVISDSGMAEKNQPTILYGLKGFTGIEITLTGPDHDLHSGMYGGAVRNPLMAMSHLLASMKDEKEVITIDGFYDDVEDLTSAERELMEKAPGEDFVKATNIPETVSEKGYTAKEHTMGRPTLEVNGLFGGYQEMGQKQLFHLQQLLKLRAVWFPARTRRIFKKN